MPLIYPALLDRLSPGFFPAALARHDVAIALVGSLLLAVSAKLQIAFWPVPMTLQTLVVLLLAMVLGFRLGTITTALYVTEGALGLPVFAGTPERGIGIAYIVGPTGGYLVGFLVAAALCGLLAEQGWDRSGWRAAAAMSAGHTVILFLGWAWLAMLIGPEAAYASGVAPFYVATVAKTLLGVASLALVWRILGRRTKTFLS
jgi:biotin transport system substrate-specific component